MNMGSLLNHRNNYNSKLRHEDIRSDTHIGTSKVQVPMHELASLLLGLLGQDAMSPYVAILIPALWLVCPWLPLILQLRRRCSPRGSSPMQLSPFSQLAATRTHTPTPTPLFLLLLLALPYSYPYSGCNNNYYNHYLPLLLLQDF